jgi:8-oxo-dGTP pyrophosphatase MutT (NUDIX family)
MTVDEITAPADAIPRIPASASALIFDPAGDLLVLKTTYKKRWSLPGGQIEEDGETPWEACRRETLEECGLQFQRGTLICVDFLRPRPDRVGGLRFVFDCGTFSHQQLSTLRLQAEEIEAHRFVPPMEAVRMLTRPVGRRVREAIRAGRFIYLEDGRPVDDVG